MTDTATIRRRGRWLVRGSVLLLCVWVLVPIYLLFLNTFTSPENVTAFPKDWLPNFNIQSLKFFLQFQGVASALWNSVEVATLTMILSVSFGAPAGYALSRFDFRGKNVFRVLVLMTRAFPLPLLALPLAVMYIRVGLDDTALGLALVHTTLALPFAVLITFSLFAGIPVELEEAAWTLGCTRIQAFRKVVLPLVTAGDRGFGDLCLRHLVERGLRRLGADGAAPDADGLPADLAGRFPAAAEIRGRLHPGPARADLHLCRAQVPFRDVGHRQPIGARDGEY